MKNTKNDNRLMKFTTFVLLSTIIVISLVSGTFAKYTTSVSGKDKATVAKWSVKLDDNDVTTQTEDISFELFGESGVYDLKDVGDTNDLSGETGVVDNEVVKTGKKVAPGTWGKVTFKVANASDVSADYAIVVKSLSTTLPLKFSTNGTTWVDASNITSNYNLGNGTLAVGSTTATEDTVDLYWKWEFDAADDTTLGAAGTAICELTAGVTFTQVD